MLDPRDRRTLGRWSRPLLVALVALAFSIVATRLSRPLDDAEPEPAPPAAEPAPKVICAEPTGPDTHDPEPTAAEPAWRKTRADRVRAAFGYPSPPPLAPTPRLRPSPAPPEASPEPVAAEPDVAAGEAVETTDAPVVRGVWPTDADGIRSAVREALPDLRQCYDAWLQAHPDLGGTVKASFTIAADADGAEAGVTEVHLQESTVGQPFLEGCVLNVLSALRFEPPPDGPVTVTYPFVLRSERQPP